VRIGINGLDIAPQYRGGINSYLRGLLDGFARQETDHRFVIFAQPGNVEWFAGDRDRFDIEVIDHYANWRYQAMRGMLLTGSPDLFKAGVDVLYGDIARRFDRACDLIYTPTTVLFPYNNAKPTLISMHDIQQFHFPEFFDRRELRRRHITFNLSARHANFVQASSAFIKADLLEHFPQLGPDQIVVISEGVDIPTFSRPRETAYLLEKYGLPERFLFFPAQLWHHKNHLTVLKAIEGIKRRHGQTIPLVMTGAKSTAYQPIMDFIQSHGMDFVHYLGVVPFDDLLALYQQARFLITAVLYESNSLPVLEAAASGTAIIASDTPPNREVAEHLQLNLFDPRSPEALEELLLGIWDDQELIEGQQAHNQQAIERYSWDAVARQYLSFVERAC
jgi:glycosyltransferase involved in cell wall biosynthesis